MIEFPSFRYVTPLPDEPLFCDGERVRESHAVRRGDMTALSQNRLPHLGRRQESKLVSR